MNQQQHLHPLTKKPKVEQQDEEAEAAMGPGGGGSTSVSVDEQEEALVALIEHRTKEVEHLRQRTAYYQSQLEDAERRLKDSHSKLGRLRQSQAGGRTLPSQPEVAVAAAAVNNTVLGSVKAEGRTSASPFHVAATASNGVVRPPPVPAAQPQSRPPLIIPAVRPKITARPPMAETRLGRAMKTEAAAMKSESGAMMSESGAPRPEDTAGRQRPDAPTKLSPQREDATQSKGGGTKMSKRKLQHKEHTDLIPNIRGHSSPSIIRFQPGMLISSHHKRKLRSLELNPVNDQLFVTSALDGVVNLWQVQAKGPVASILSGTDCLSPKHRRWPEDIAWHPDGDSLFSVYNADGGDAQISILNLNSSREKRVSFLQEKPHFKGIINSIQFMPWVDLCFMTGGSDHAVIHWHEKDDENAWKPKAVHRNVHSSGVMGVAGLQHKKIVLSAGADKRIIGFDMLAGRADFKHQIESKCMSVLPNPSDFNLFVVQTGAPGKQLRLFDIRLRQTEIHSFGWKQESSESQSALINQAWSPDGLYITSGSADPMIHIFDIRYDSRNPSQSVQAHQKRVFKAVWHQSQTLLISISSDLNIGLHKIA